MLITDFVLSKKVSARDLLGERLKKFGIREHVASGKDDERSRCLTDGSQCLAVFLSEDLFVDFLTAYGETHPERYSMRFARRLQRRSSASTSLSFWIYGRLRRL